MIDSTGTPSPIGLQVGSGSRLSGSTKIYSSGTLEITNRNAGPEEFESTELRKETVLAPGVTRKIMFAPLKAGRYPFFGEFHPDTAKGEIVAK